MNEELVQSAISFLRDPSVTSSPLNKKIEFLQSKGLNELEIEEALARANDNSTPQNQASPSQSAPSQVQPAPQQAYPPMDYYNAPAVPDRSWKDYFIMATATAGVAYGVYQVVLRYVIPSLVPPSQTSIDGDKKQIEEEFVKIDKMLEQLAAEQKQIKQSNDEKLQEIDDVITSVNDFLTKYNKDKLVFDDDLRLMKLEIDNLKNSVERNLNLQKENLKDDLGDINEELASLKNIVQLRAKELDRKLTPVSSIPLALEVLKRAKSGASSGASASPKPAEATAKDSASPKPAEATAKETTATAKETTATASDTATSGVRFAGISEPTTVDGVTAGGIPEWQMKHKLQEEANDVVSDTINKVGVPAWQLNLS